MITTSFVCFYCAQTIPYHYEGPVRNNVVDGDTLCSKSLSGRGTGPHRGYLDGWCQGKHQWPVRGSYKEDGRSWCKNHAPSFRKARSDARAAANRDKWAAYTAERKAKLDAFDANTDLIRYDLSTKELREMFDDIAAKARKVI